MNLFLLANLSRFKSLGDWKELTVYYSMQLCLPAKTPFPFWLNFTCWLVVPPEDINFQDYSFGSCFCSMIQLIMRQRSRLKMLVLDYMVFPGCCSKRVCLGRLVLEHVLHKTGKTGWLEFGKLGRRAYILSYSECSCCMD